MLRKLLLTLAGIIVPILVTAQLTIIVDNIPESTPPGDPIYLATDFIGWTPDNPYYQLIEDTIQRIHHVKLNAAIGDIRFKFTRGSWHKVESDEDGNFIPNRFCSTSDVDTIRLQILGWEDLDGNGWDVSTAADNVNVITDSFPIPQLDRYRRIWIYLPPDYQSSGYSYPVLYMHDGQNLFDKLTSYIGEWEVDETLNDLHKKGDPGIIVVGIDNGRGNRIHEYSPWVNSSYNVRGEGGAYVDFIVEYLKPFIDSSYRTLPESENTGIMGSSLGGLISLYAGIEFQDVFSKVGAFSPAYWINPEIFEHVSANGKQDGMKIFQITGTLEGENYVDNMFDMQDSLFAAGFGQEEILTMEKTDGDHNERFWAREFENAYLWLFRDGALNVDEKNISRNNLTLYPNPTGENIILEFNIVNSEEVRVDIIDCFGSLRKSIYANTLQAGDQRLNLDLGKWGLPPGTYFCRIIAGRDVTSLKFVIVK